MVEIIVLLFVFEFRNGFEPKFQAILSMFSHKLQTKWKIFFCINCWPFVINIGIVSRAMYAAIDVESFEMNSNADVNEISPH